MESSMLGFPLTSRDALPPTTNVELSRPRPGVHLNFCITKHVGSSRMLCTEKSI